MTSLLAFSPLLAADPARLLWAVPASLAISYVYTASRYESTATILKRGAGMFVKTLLFLAAVFAALYVLSYDL